MHWVLQENLFRESEWDNMVATLERFNIPYSVHKVVPFIGELMPPVEPKAEKVICFGSYSMRHTAKREGWDPGVYDLEPMSFPVQLENWGDLMLNADATVSKFGDVDFGDNELLFIRPIEDSKVFAGSVFERDEFKDWQYRVCKLEEDTGTSLTKYTLVQTCAPKTIYAEYRFWIVDMRIVSASMYKRGGRVVYSDQVDKRVHDFVQYVLRFEKGKRGVALGGRPAGWEPHRAFVLDVCETPDGMKIVEPNTINAAGFYAGNVQDIIMALEQMEGM